MCLNFDVCLQQGRLWHNSFSRVEVKLYFCFMKKIMTAGALALGILSFAQKSPIRAMIPYAQGSDMALVKAKTDLFLLNVLSSDKFKMTTNSSAQDHLDMGVVLPFQGGEIRTRLRHDFLKEGHVVSLSQTKIHRGSVVEAVDQSKESHQVILDQLERLFIDTYKKEISGK